MTSNNQIIDINNDKYLIRKAATKLVLHHLPSLDIVHKYYSQVDYFCVNKHEMMLLFKNVITFLKLKCPPLRLIQYQQEYLDWEPIGGLSMANMLILYDKSTIAFYYRNPKLEKSWAIDVVQEIEQVKSSHDENFIALKVKQPKNIIFIWDMGNISKKPNQQIILKQKITKWIFYGKNILLIMTQSELKVYFVNQKTNTHFIQYYIPLHRKYTSFLPLNNFNQTQINTGRKSVNTIAFLNEHSCNFQIVELYDIQKRQRVFKCSDSRPLVFDHLGKTVFSQAIAGYQYQGKIIILGQVDTGTKSYQPKCLVLNERFQLQRATQYKQHQGTQLQNIQSMHDYVLFLDKNHGKYKIGKFVSHDGSKNLRGASDRILYFNEYQEGQLQNALLTNKYVLLINKEKRMAVQNLQQLEKGAFQHNQKKPLQFITDFSKYNPKGSFYIFQNTSGIFFVCGIRYFKYDFQKKQIVSVGFVMKNQRAKLHEVRTSTHSLVYKINAQYILIEYNIPTEEGQKVIFRTIKSSQNDKIISLRKDRWVKMNIKDIILGQGQIQLATFNLQKMYKSLLQDNSYFQYDLYWTTHGGMILAVKNYLFFLQIIQNQNGYEIHLIKKGHSYLHRRFSSSLKKEERVKVVDPRNLIVYTGNRIAKLSTQVQSYITGNPYELPDTLLNRQLKMREYYPPHHPNIINAMIQNGWFTQVIKMMQKVQKWVKTQQHTIKDLYKILSTEDYYQWKQQVAKQQPNNQQKYQLDQVMVMVKSAPPRNELRDIQLLNDICQEVIARPEQFKLTQNSPLLLENLLKAVVFKLQNSRAFDYFTQTIIAKTKILKSKSAPFDMMDVAFLTHSINKDQAVQFLKAPDHKIEWSWFQKYSIVLWYQQNVQKWRKWVQQIAMTQFRTQKDAFDCLFWYILANKKNILITLFKSQKFSSKQHDAMHTFLQRDFQDPKHKSAALKNAYALIDKKRYMHAMAFFLLADKKQQCVRFAIDRLHDLNLGYLIHILCNGANSDQTNWVSKNMIQKGDIWAKHVGWVMERKHIASYNVLFKDESQSSWDYLPQLKAFHPAVIQFSQKIKQSLPYKRQLEAKNSQVQQPSMSQNVDSFSFDQNVPQSKQNQNITSSKTIQTKVQKQKADFYQQYLDLFEELPPEEQNGFRRALRQKGIRYYMRYHLPCLALTLKASEQNGYLHSDAKRAYQLQKYILTGQLSKSVVEIAEGLDDIMSLLTNDLKLQSYASLLLNLTDFRQRFECLIKKIKINELNPPSKHQIGELLHYSYLSQRIFIQIEPLVKDVKDVEDQLMVLSKTNNFGKIMVGVSLKMYSQMGKNLEAFKNQLFIQANAQFWVTAREKYDGLTQKKKQKHPKLMDTFELSLNSHAKKLKDQDHSNFSIRMPKSSTMSILLWRKIFEFLAKCDQYLKQKVLQLKVRLDKIVTYWVQKEYLSQIQSQIAILIAQGAQYRLKLNVLSTQFKQKQLDTIEQLLKLIYSSRDLRQLQQSKRSEPNNQRQKNQKNGNTQNIEQKGAIQIFRNKTDHLKGFTLNKNSGRGLQIVTLFKKTMRKFQVVDNLSNRDRTKDGISLIHQDNAYVTDIFQITSENQMLFKSSNIFKIASCLKNVFSSRHSLDDVQIIKKSDKYSNHIADYLKPSDSVPTLDYQQINAIQTHSYLPIFFLGGKGVIQVCLFDTVKNYNRIICAGMQQIIKIQSVGQRIYALDKQGNLSCYLFDYEYNNRAVFELKKQGIIDFVCPKPSVFGFITSNSFQVYDTLLHPKRQCILKIQMSTPPVAISYLSATQMVILRKNQVQIYDIKTNQLVQSFNVNGRGRSLHVDKSTDKILVGRNDCRVKIIQLVNKTQRIVKIGSMIEQKQKIYIQSIKSFGTSYICFRNDGSIYYFND